MTYIELITSLVPDLLDGKEEAVDKLVSLSLRRLIRVALRYGAPPEDAKEIAFDAISNTLPRLANLSFDTARGKDPLFNYMARAARNGAIKLHRSKVKEQEVLKKLAASLAADRAPTVPRLQAAEPDDDTEDSDELRESFSDGSGQEMSPEVVAMRGFLATLSERDRLILQLHAERVMTSKEIADAVGWSDTAVRQTVKRLHDRFRKERQNVGP